MSSRIL